MNVNEIAHGLITWANKPVYDKACIPLPPPPGLLRPNENISVHVLQNVLNKVIFAGDERYDTVFVNSQCPPLTDSDLRADLAINYTTASDLPHTTCFIKATGTHQSEYYDICAVEDQVLNYCEDFFDNKSNTGGFIYAATLVGVHIRLWIVHNHDRKLKALWGDSSRGTSSDYKDLGDSASAELIKKTFRDMLEKAPDPWFYQSGASITSNILNGSISAF
ncbi:hypothetical protein ANOM_001121 [Aspergillus nomiae NRRL 13137]|uniref:Uncharacterized protein n=1 Tax=Aspergillus nomiae NRRL (strain ATCC 15546 / NRRL 13137 / CBS 260.88 / M93) TaxID=1509407 RepID=A0A0L1JG30_ASPN3|nr:uncharacterized protein ANOM_001121 [Aspergillus nomiae NRRL 13137]KNG90711.1 hypothetical protein ANOM_001121 [Aspergillus nomiae NRRL 13137]